MEDGAVGYNFDMGQTTQGPFKQMFGLIWSSDFRLKKSEKCMTYDGRQVIGKPRMAF